MSKDTALDYFQAFARKDMLALTARFAPGVSLTDGEVHAEGIEAVMAVNIRLFQATDVIRVTPVSVFAEARWPSPN